MMAGYGQLIVFNCGILWLIMANYGWLWLMIDVDWSHSVGNRGKEDMRNAMLVPQRSCRECNNWLLALGFIGGVPLVT